MTIPDNTRRPSAVPAIGKPSLIGGSHETEIGANGGATIQPLRMLDALDATRPGQRSVAPTRIRSWLLALSLTMLVVAAVSWWQQRSDVEAASKPLRAPTSEATVAAPVPPAEPVASKSPEIVAAAPAGGPASIERSADANPPAVLARPAAQTAPPTLPTRAHASAPRSSRTAAASSKRVAAHRAPTKVTSAPARPAAARHANASASARDPDVTLLSAMLARLSGDNPADAAAQRATIAQLVERCEARSGKEPSETLECKRQICAGYWGKAEACPLALKKN